MPPADSFFDEDRGLQATDSRLALRLLRYVAPFRSWIILSSVISLGMALLQLAGPYFVKVAIDDHITVGEFNGVALLSGYYAATLAGLFVLEYLQACLIAYVGQHAMFDLRAEIFAKMQGQSAAFFDRNPVGRLMTRITSDVQALNELFSQGIMTLAGDIFLLVAIAALMVYVDFTLSLLVFATLPLLFLAAEMYRRHARAAFSETRSRLSRLNTYLQENISGVRTIQAHNREQRNESEFMGLNNDYRHAQVKTVLQFAIFVPVIELIAALAVAVIVWYGGMASVQGAMSLGTVVLFIQYTQRLFQPIRDLTDKFNIFQTAIASSERVFKLLDTPVTVETPAQPRRFEGMRESMSFDGVWFAYNTGEWVLKDINLTIRRGETVALVGHTGSGKTTLTSLVPRFHDPQKGAVRIDGTDIREFALPDLRQSMAIVLQDSFLFSGDMASNIRLGEERITDEAVRAAAQAVNAAQFIEALPGGYATPVRERGATLSVGQKQLIAFARALAFEPDILILDEATASIDTETESLIQDALGKLLAGRTALVVAHRLSTIQNADRIVVLHHGAVHETGTHAELLQKDGLYRKLYELQYRGNGRAADSAHGAGDDTVETLPEPDIVGPESD